MRIRTLTTELWLPRPISDVFHFFSDAGNLDRLTPPWLHFRILAPLPLVMNRGTLIDYTIRWRWVPLRLRWQSAITLWEPPHVFVDEQVRGPYRQWIHRHGFEERDGGTLVRDRVDYAVPGWLAEPLLHRVLIGPDLDRIFSYRQQRLQELLT